MASENPRKWRFTWESQSHIPILKLYLFSHQFNPVNHCDKLIIDLILEKSILKLSWSDRNLLNLVSLIVPLPRVLVDLESPLHFRTLDDHIEVKIPLLLPVDHPIVASFISDLHSGGYDDQLLTPLTMDSDFKELSSKGDVHVYCRSCRFKLTKTSVRCLVDLPSVNWTDVADNWFGSCCCSFGSISEKLVTKYVKLNKCTEGSCLLTSASIILFKDDVTGFQTLSQSLVGKCDGKFSDDTVTENLMLRDSSTEKGSMQLQSEGHSMDGVFNVSDDHEKTSFTSSSFDLEKDTESENHCCTHDAPKSFPKDEELNGSIYLQEEQKSFLNCYLGNAFLFTPSGLSKDIEWTNFSCPQCSHVLGAFPSTDGSEPLDGGIRLLKCYISVSSSSSVPDGLFRKYTLERMFTCQLLESAKDELSFRTVVKDLKTKCSMLNMILVNPNSWCFSGWCLEDTSEQFVMINLHPVVKVLLSHCSDNLKSEVRSGIRNSSHQFIGQPLDYSEAVYRLKISFDLQYKSKLGNETPS
ncbi:uncharacterized protein LOC141623838 isoform X2 [Silene latifolia]|uniref:uncharacterized protein LOC141623838 isoform X2 n=1 Tax=Silene latifolia TaxID=37657 RepID=UPI003D77C0E7